MYTINNIFFSRKEWDKSEMRISYHISLKKYVIEYTYFRLMVIQCKIITMEEYAFLENMIFFLEDIFIKSYYFVVFFCRQNQHQL